MNWLAQMLHTEIDLHKMYRVSDRGGDDKFTALVDANRKRSADARAAVLAALGDDSLTSSQLKARLKSDKDVHVIFRLLRRMEKDGLVSSTADPEGRKIVKWRKK